MFVFHDRWHLPHSPLYPKAPTDELTFELYADQWWRKSSGSRGSQSWTSWNPEWHNLHSECRIWWASAQMEDGQHTLKLCKATRLKPNFTQIRLQVSCFSYRFKGGNNYFRSSIHFLSEPISDNSIHKGAGPTFLVYGNHQRPIFRVHIC